MKASDYFDIARDAILTNRLRSFLTVLSIIVGVFTIIVLSAVSHAAKKEVLSSIEKIGSKLIFVMAGKVTSISQAGRSNIDLDWKTVREIERINGISEVLPQIGTSSIVSLKGIDLNTYVYGVNEHFMSVRDYVLSEGVNFEKIDIDNMNAVCLIGHGVFRRLYQGESMLGKTLFIGKNGVPVKIIGILTEKGHNFTVDQDDRIYVPISFYQKRLFNTEQISVIYIKTESEAMIENIKTEIEHILQKNFKKEAENFTVRSQGELLSTLSFISNTFSVLILLIALISLLVGGIGIMNVMLIAVNERMHEIGVRKSLGARSSEIEVQFLLEAVILTIIGAFAGLAFAFIAQFLLVLIVDWDFYFPFRIAALSVVISILIGLFFGYYPAKKAARVSPAETLRAL